MSPSRLALASLLLAVLPALAAAMGPKPVPAADPFAEHAAAGRAVLKRLGEGVITVELVATISVTVNERSMPPREQKIEVNGTVISPAGLTVTSLATIDPHSAFEMTRMASNQKITFGETDFKEVKLKLSDGTEIPAKVILKDQDLDLAFIAPDTEDAKAVAHAFTAVDLTAATDGQILDQFYTLSRAPKALQQVPEAVATTVVGIVQKPRRLYIMNPDQVGCPTVDAAGRVLGICVEHGGGRPMPIILPAADVAELAAQATALLPKVEKPAAAKTK